VVETWPPFSSAVSLMSLAERAEVGFGIVHRRPGRCDTFGFRKPHGQVLPFIDGWNDRAHPVVWTTPPDEILSKLTVEAPNTQTRE